MTESRIDENPFIAPPPPCEFADQLSASLEIQDDGVGPRWEQPGPLIQRFLETLWSSLTRPWKFFGDLRRQGSWWMPIAYLLMISLLGMCASLLVNSPGIASVVVAKLVAMNSLGIITMGFVACVFHMALRLTGPSSTFRATWRATFYAVASAAILNLIPTVGEWIATIATIVLTIIALQQVHRISGVRAIFVVLAATFTIYAILIAAYIMLLAIGVIAEPN